MKKNITLLSLVAISICSVSCKENKYTELAKVKWVLGNWENISPQGTLRESWEKQNDSTFLGNSYFLKDKDTLFSEKITLQQRGDQLSYVPVVPNQNSGKAISFVMTSVSDKQFVFENPKHDFPQRITYNLIRKDSISAQISGTENGKEKIETFAMNKVK